MKEQESGCLHLGSSGHGRILREVCYGSRANVSAQVSCDQLIFIYATQRETGKAFYGEPPCSTMSMMTVICPHQARRLSNVLNKILRQAESQSSIITSISEKPRPKHSRISFAQFYVKSSTHLLIFHLHLFIYTGITIMERVDLL
jgi:hypothetical protein